MQEYPLIKNKRVAVLGAGITGQAVVKFLAKQKVPCIAVFDENNIDLEILKFLENFNCEIYPENDGADLLDKFDLLITSPSFEQDHQTITKARKLGIAVYNDITLFLTLLPHKEAVIAVTGSNGKSTTVSLIAHILKESGKKVFLAGNIGISPLEFLEKADNESYFILEVSSYQLEMFDDKNYFDYSVITNITQNHLDRYAGDFSKYAKTKCLVSHDKTKATIVNLDDPLISKYQKLVCGQDVFIVSLVNPVTNLAKNAVYLTGNDVLTFFDKKGQATEVDIKNRKIIGIHNIYNIAYAIAVCLLNDLGAKEIQQAIASFEGLEHRIEFVCKQNSVTWINDSKSTSPDALLTAVSAVDSDKIILIAGGKEKNFDYKSVLKDISDKILGLVLLPGSGSERFGAEFIKIKKDLTLVKVANIEEAIKASGLMSKEDSVVLLSPAMASEVIFKNFEERGKAFKEAVKKIICS